MAPWTMIDHVWPEVMKPHCFLPGLLFFDCMMRWCHLILLACTPLTFAMLKGLERLWICAQWKKSPRNHWIHEELFAMNLTEVGPGAAMKSWLIHKPQILSESLWLFSFGSLHVLWNNVPETCPCLTVCLSFLSAYGIGLWNWMTFHPVLIRNYNEYRKGKNDLICPGWLR